MKTLEEKIAVMQAAAEGKQIEHKTLLGSDAWRKCYLTFIDWNWTDYDYRVKPEEPKPKYVPYENAEEFLAAMKEHGMYITENQFRRFYTMPDTVNNDGILLNCDNADSITGFEDISWNKLCKDYIWQDGTPCGKLKGE